MQLAEAYRVVADQAAVIGQLQARVERLEHRAGKDSPTSSKPSSSDSPYKKKPRDRSLREKGKRPPGKQPGEPGATMNLVGNPKYRFWYPPAECRECGTGLAGQEVFAQRRHQVTDIRPAPEPEVTEHVAQSKECPCCGEVSEGALPPGVRARAAFGPETRAQAANLTCGNYVPSRRAAELMAAMAGIGVSLGWIAGVRAKTAALVESSGFMDLVAGLLRQAGAVHADETPARAAGGMRYVHLACTPYLTRMHTGDRSADAAGAGGVLPGYTGILVRDGYHGGYGHFTDALHAWCGAQYAESGIMRNGAAGAARVACRGGDRSDAQGEKFCIITGSRGRRGRGQAGDTVRAWCWAGSSARVPVLSAEGLRGGRSGLFADPRVPAIVRWWPGQPRCAAGSSRRCGEGYERRFSWQRVRGSPLLLSARA